jgi:hypothetical protein
MPKVPKIVVSLRSVFFCKYSPLAVGVPRNQNNEMMTYREFLF